LIGTRIAAEKTRVRTVTISLQDLRSWLNHASYHVRLASCQGMMIHQING